ncbi:hypothetical protein LZ554_001415 [Drepanopeziza brunnea f. sp. 'monogermtubi']|nr:hypothetical protein LZ554_001415 [Drepanopeziza brunnea f. sp. 'monogermtubi']
MQLCRNHREGFGPSSSISSPLPTSCFTDVILVPLPIWIALALLPILFVLSLRHRQQNYNPSTAYLRSVPRWSWGYIVAATVYYLFIIANALMLTLEIVRLELIHFGIGLIPFVYAGLLIGLLLHWGEGARGRMRGWQAVNYIIWIGGVAMSVIKVVGLDKEGINLRKESKYPLGDQVTDIAVMAGVYAVIAVLEVVLGVWRRKRRSEVEMPPSPQRGTAPFMESAELGRK